MKNPQNVRAAKIASVRSVSEAPQHSWPEVAFVGRSNVGKSSLLTMLTGLRNLAPVSKTPGRTKSLGFYALKNPELCLVDLPGYGWAQLGQDMRRQIATMISDYVTTRSNLLGLILLIDARRAELTDDDWAMVKLAMEAERALLVVLTKSDKLSKNQLSQARMAVEKALEIPKGSIIPVSSLNGTGKKELWVQITQLLKASKEPAEATDEAATTGEDSAATAE